MGDDPQIVTQTFEVEVSTTVTEGQSSPDSHEMVDCLVTGLQHHYEHSGVVVSVTRQ